MKSTLPAAIAATLLALIATAAPASANVTNPADNPYKITVTGDDGRTYVDGQDTLPGYDDEECTYIPGAWFDFDNNRVRYPDGQSIPWTEWERATGYNEWLAKKAAGTPVNTTAPTEPVSNTSPTKPVSTTSPTRPESTTSPTKPGSTTSPTGQVTASGTNGSTSHAGGSVSTATSGGNVASPSSAGTGTAFGAGANQVEPGSTALPSLTAFAADEPGEGSATGRDKAGSEVLAQGAAGAGANSGTNSGSAAGLAILGSLFGAIGLAFGGYAFVKSGRRTPPVVGA